MPFYVYSLLIILVCGYILGTIETVLPFIKSIFVSIALIILIILGYCLGIKTQTFKMTYECYDKKSTNGLLYEKDQLIKCETIPKK